MSVRIKSVDKNSIAQRHRIEAGWILEKINAHEINDVLDYQFYLKESTLALQMLDDSGKRRYIIIRKNADDDIGLNFETYLMDSQHHCKNKCIFCFIDQLPRGMRDSLYFKDDDSRLSFLFGNYITLTNLTEHDVDRIIEQYEWADIIISVSPSYWADIPGQFKAFIDRCTPWCNTHEPHAKISSGKKGYAIALRTGPSMKECERI